MVDDSRASLQPALDSWLAAIVEFSAEAIISETLDDILTTWNPAAERLYGYRAGEAIGQPMTILIPLDRWDEERQILARIGRGEQVERITTERLRKTGPPVTVRGTVSPIRDAAGNIVGASHIAHDFTDSQRVVARLHLQDQILGTVKDAIIAINEKRIITSWNPAAEVIYGWAADEVIGRSVIDVLQTEYDGTTQEERHLSTLATAEYRGEVRQRRKDGSVVEIECVAKVLYDSDGNVTGMVAVNRDITDRKLAVEALRESQARTESVLASVADAHTLFDWQWRYIYANRATIEAVGRPRESILGHRLWELYPDLIGTEIECHYHRAMDERLPIVFDFHYLDKDTWWENRFYPVPEGLAVFATNITERKRAELARSKLAAIIESSDEAIYSKNLAGILLTWNAAAERLYGYSADEAIGRSVSMLVPPDRPTELSFILERVARGERIQHFETTRARKDGALVQVSVTISPVRDASGRIAGASAIARDISERKRAEAALQGAHARLLVLSAHLLDVQEAERRALARDLHDRVGQNLTALNINLNIIRAQLQPGAAASLDQRIADSLALVRDMTGSTRDVMVELHPPLLDDFGLLAALRAYAEGQAQRMSMAITVTGDQRAPRLPALMEIGLFRIVQEALNNVAKHSGASQAWVSLVDTAAGLHVTVSDNGTGFKPATYPIDAQTGRGLMTMRERAEALGGRFVLETVPGQGTRIEIDIRR